MLPSGGLAVLLESYLGFLEGPPSHQKTITHSLYTTVYFGRDNIHIPSWYWLGFLQLTL